MTNITLNKFEFRKWLQVCLIISIPCMSDAQWTKKDQVWGAGRWGAMSFTVANKIYVGGGYRSGTNNNDLVFYDPATGKWAPAMGQLPGASNRTGGVAFTINGKAYLGLGAQDYNSFTVTPKYLNDLWEYDEVKDKWTQKKSLPDSGRADAGIFVANNKAYVVGGARSTWGKTNEVWEYDPSADKWTKKKPLADLSSVEHPFAFSINNMGYIIGGTTTSDISDKTFQYNPSSDTWTSKKEYLGGKAQGGVAFVVNGKAVCGLGGTFSSAANGGYPKDFYVYDPTLNSWAKLFGSNFKDSGRLFGVAQVIGGKAYIGAGWRLEANQSTQNFFNDWYELDAQTLLGITESKIENSKLTCFPNPAKDVLHIDVNNGHYNIYNLAGHKVSSGSINNDKTVNISTLSSGQYVVEISTAEQTIRGMVTVKN